MDGCWRVVLSISFPDLDCKAQKMSVQKFWVCSKQVFGDWIVSMAVVSGLFPLVKNFQCPLYLTICVWWNVAFGKFTELIFSSEAKALWRCGSERQTRSASGCGRDWVWEWLNCFSLWVEFRISERGRSSGSTGSRSTRTYRGSREKKSRLGRRRVRSRRSCLFEC